MRTQGVNNIYEGCVSSVSAGAALKYYSFGAPMPGRVTPFQTSVDGMSDGSASYRYGFNGKENDFEPKNSQGSQQDYGMRIYDPRLGRFLSVDPITSKYPELTSYQFASNNPIEKIDVDGLEGADYWVVWEKQNENFWDNATTEEKKRVNAVSTTIGALPIAIYAVATSAPAALAAGIRASWWAANPVNQQMVVGLGGLVAGAIDPNPNSDYPGGLDDILRGGKLLLGKKFVLEKYAKKIEDSYNMFKEGFGLGIPKWSYQSSQILQAMYQTVKQGKKIAFDVTGVDLSLAKKGFESYIKADEAGKITEWELSKILRDKDLYNNTIFHTEGKEKTAKELGLEYIEK